MEYTDKFWLKVYENSLRVLPDAINKTSLEIIIPFNKRRDVEVHDKKVNVDGMSLYEKCLAVRKCGAYIMESTTNHFIKETIRLCNMSVSTARMINSMSDEDKEIFKKITNDKLNPA